MTKAELQEELTELQEKVEQLENDVDYWQHEYWDLEEIKEELDEELSKYSGGIMDIDNFIWRLKLDNLYTDKLNDFINDYIKLYNEKG